MRNGNARKGKGKNNTYKSLLILAFDIIIIFFTNLRPLT